MKLFSEDFKIAVIHYFLYIVKVVSHFVMGSITHLVPIHKRRIMFISFSGNQYSCSPKYLSEYLNTHNHGEFEIIWALRNMSLGDGMPREFKKVKYVSLQYFYYYMSSKFIITNVNVSKLIPKKKNQVTINTTHGGGLYKKAAKDFNNMPSEWLLIKGINYENKNTTAYLSCAQMFTSQWIRKSVDFGGDVIDSGLPRNDVFFYDESQKQRIRDKVYDHFGVPKNEHILLYAPTYHDNSKAHFIAFSRGTNEMELSMDVDALSEAAAKRFGGKWRLMVRAHLGDSLSVPGILNATSYPDMQELLLASDMLISDYSSCIWDFSFSYQPCFLYAYDLSQYDQNRGFYIPIHEWGFPVCETFDTLINAILNFDEEEYKKKMKHHHDYLGSYEAGHACERMVEYIIRKV